jgi:hypothetical protein
MLVAYGAIESPLRYLVARGLEMNGSELGIVAVLGMGNKCRRPEKRGRADDGGKGDHQNREHPERNCGES